MKKVIIVAIAGIATYFIFNSLSFMQVTHMLSLHAMLYISIFLMVIVGLIIDITAPALVGFVGICVIASLGLPGTPKESIKWALSGFGNGVIWLIFAAFMFAKGYEKSGLGKRIALLLIKLLGKRTLTMGYAIVFMEIILGPFIPSNTARSAGTIFPIIKNIPPMYDSFPEKNRKKIGSYLMWIGICSACLTSTLFLTGLAPNLLAVSLVEKGIGLKIQWMQWFGYTAIPFTILLLLVPIITYFIYPPELKKSEEISIWASEELGKLGKLSFVEIKMLTFSIIALILWLFAGKYLNSTTVAIDVLALMVLFGVIDWKDVLENSAAWNVFIWFSTLVALAGGLKTVGFLAWVGDISRIYLAGLSPTIIFFSIIAIFFFIHYIFASVTAHATALLPIMLVIGSATLPHNMIEPLALILVFSLGIMGIITPYATGPAPIWYGSNYISSKEYWGLGFVFGILFFVVLAGLAFFLI